jgi:hypothetical protein
MELHGAFQLDRAEEARGQPGIERGLRQPRTQDFAGSRSRLFERRLGRARNIGPGRIALCAENRIDSGDLRFAINDGKRSGGRVPSGPDLHGKEGAEEGCPAPPTAKKHCESLMLPYRALQRQVTLHACVGGLHIPVDGLIANSNRWASADGLVDQLDSIIWRMCDQPCGPWLLFVPGTPAPPHGTWRLRLCVPPVSSESETGPKSCRTRSDEGIQTAVSSAWVEARTKAGTGAASTGIGLLLT